VLILTMHQSEQLMQEALTAGAKGFLLKSDAGSMLFPAIESLSRNEPFFTSKVSDMMLKAYLNPDLRAGADGAASEALTVREREIIQLIAEGKTSKEIAAMLGISVRTSETHRTNLMRKLGVHSVSEIVRYAIRSRMIDA